MLIGKINNKNRQKLLVTIREVKGVKMMDFRLHHTADDGELIGATAGVSLSLDQLEQAIELFQEAKRVIAKQQ